MAARNWSPGPAARWREFGWFAVEIKGGANSLRLQKLHQAGRFGQGEFPPGMVCPAGSAPQRRNLNHRFNVSPQAGQGGALLQAVLFLPRDHRTANQMVGDKPIPELITFTAPR